jgi:hypothetical protein
MGALPLLRLDFKFECVSVKFPPLVLSPNRFTILNPALIVLCRIDVRTKGPWHDESASSSSGGYWVGGIQLSSLRRWRQRQHGVPATNCDHTTTKFLSGNVPGFQRHHRNLQSAED